MLSLLSYSSDLSTGIRYLVPNYPMVFIFLFIVISTKGLR